MRGSLIKGLETGFVGWKRRDPIGFASARKAAVSQAASGFVVAFCLKSFSLISVGLHLATADVQRFKENFLFFSLKISQMCSSGLLYKCFFFFSFENNFSVSKTLSAALNVVLGVELRREEQ